MYETLLNDGKIPHTIKSLLYLYFNTLHDALHKHLEIWWASLGR